MPNYVKNTVTVQHKNPKEIMEAMDGDDGAFDFNNLVPMPDELKGIQCMSDGEGDVFYRTEDLEKAEIKDLAFADFTDDFPMPKIPTPEWVRENRLDEFTVKRLIKEHGAAYWYEWCIYNWGTKWPATEVTTDMKDNQLVYDFYTAWDAPFPVMRKFFEYAKDNAAQVKWEYQYEGGYPDDKVHTINSMGELL